MKKLTKLLLLFCALLSFNFQAQKSKLNKAGNYKNIVLFWDTSLSLQSRDISLELDFLDNFIKDKKDISIHLVKFSTSVLSEKTYAIANSKWNDLKTALINTTYDGATSFAPLTEVKYNTYDAFLVFTDGFQNETLLKSDISKPMIVVGSTTRLFLQSLQLKTLSNDSRFIDLNNITLTEALKEVGITPKVAVSYHKARTNNVIFDKVKGYISSSNGPLEGVNIIVEGKKTGAISNNEGYYTISAKKGDKLKFSSLGYNTFETFVQDPFLDVRLLTDETRLNTVEIKGKTKEVIKDQEAIGSKQRRKIGYNVTTIKSEDFNKNTNSVSDNVRGKVSSAEQGVDQDISKMVLRGRYYIVGNVYPLVVLDGNKLQRADYSDKVSMIGGGVSNFINPDNVAKIKILRGLAATNLYGSAGRNGVIEITSKTASIRGKKQQNNALVKGNIYKENLNNSEHVNASYIKALEATKSISDGYEKYLKLRDNYANSVTFFLEVSDYFKQKNATFLSDRILSNVLEQNFNNPIALKALAFKYEANNEIDKAIYVYKRILRLRPKSAQSYKDIATIYAKNGYITKAFYLYKSMLENTIRNVDFNGLKISNRSEFKNLIQRNKNAIPKIDISQEFLGVDNINARLYFEWINSDMSFEIQFVNPQKRFFSWTHSENNDATRIKNEKDQGFTAEEFLLIDAAKGEWLINLTNLDDKYPKNQILKLSLFKNYGKPNQTHVIKVINLKNYSKKASLIKVKI